MEKIYRLLDWLEMAQAVNWLEDLTKTRISGTELLQLCGAGQCSVYLDCDGRSVDLETGDDWPPLCQATGLGMSKVRTPLRFMDNSSSIDLLGPVSVNSTGVKIEEGCFLLAGGYDSPRPRFKPSDIEALAAKMNGEDEQPNDRAAEVEDLRQQWEQEHLARMLETRQQDEEERKERFAEELLTALSALEKKLEQERTARQAAEARAAELRRAIDEDHYAREAAERDAADEMANKYGDWWREQLRRDELLEHQATQLEQERTARQAAEQRAEQAEAEAKPSHMLAIAGLLELLLDGSRPLYKQGSTADAIEARHPDWRGSSASQLTKLFAEAKATAKEADKVAQAKVEARQAAASRAEARRTAKT